MGGPHVGHLEGTTVLVSRQWVWFLEPTEEKRHEKRGLQVGNAQLRSAVLKVPHAVPGVTPAGSAVVQSVQGRQRSVAVHGLLLAWPAARQPSDVLCILCSPASEMTQAS